MVGSVLSMRYSDSNVAGAFIFVGSAQFIIALIVAEAFYPGYSVAQNYISDLGATCRAACQIVQPTSMIFNSSVTLLGLLAIVASYFVQRGFRSRVFTFLVVMTGLGATGIGVFPETAGVIHLIVSLITFVFAGLSAILSCRVQKAPLAYFSVVLGVMTLVALGLSVSNAFLGLGPGGMERMIVYPVLIWAVGFSASLMASSTNPRTMADQ
jgi:hypothetical membrane protein